LSASESRFIDFSPNPDSLPESSFFLRRFFKGDGQQMSFEDNTFDAVFTNGSLHEWSQPNEVFDEAYRVLKPTGRYLISDLRRDMNPLVKWIMRAVTKPREIKPGLVSSINASYTPEEIRSMLRNSSLSGSAARGVIMIFVIAGEKK